MGEIDWHKLPHGGDLFGEIQLASTTEQQAARSRTTLLPGLLACGLAATTAAWLSEHYGFPINLLGLLIGLAVNFIARDPATHPGLDFAARTCLRLGIVALGFQVTFAEVQALGLTALGGLLAVMAATIAVGLAVARLVGVSKYSGLLAGGATAICGASAALALYGVIGRHRLSQAQFALTLVGISLASALAMTVYPMIAGSLHLSDRQAGFLIGASIHDVAQAIGGGYAFSNAAGSYATIVKLARVALLAPVVALASLWLNRGDAESGERGTSPLSLPWFIIAFLAVLAFNSSVTVPAGLRDATVTGAKGLLLLAVTATAMRARLDLLLELGWRAAMPVAATMLASLLAALAVTTFLIQ